MTDVDLAVDTLRAFFVSWASSLNRFAGGGHAEDSVASDHSDVAV